MSFRAAMHSILNSRSVAARRLHVRGGATVHEADTPAESAYFILDGQVRLYQVNDSGDNRLCEILGAEEWFGVGALAGSPTQGVRAVCVGRTMLVEVSVERLIAALASHPEALIEFNRQLAAKLRGAWDDAAELAFRDTTARLINILLRFSRSAASTRHNDGVVLNITHSQLAQAVGAARETISLALNQLRQQNLVRTGRNAVFFNPELLSRVQQQAQVVERVA
jgi:CRP-like cAMP-binding protein